MRSAVITVYVFVTLGLLAACNGDQSVPRLDLTVQPTDVTIERGGSATVTVGVTRSGAFTGDVTVELLDPPDGLNADALTIPSGSQSATLTVRADGAAVIGTHALTLRGEGAGISDTTTLMVMVSEHITAPGFSLSLTPSELVVQRGASGIVTVDVTRTGGFADSVEVVLVDPPAGISAEVVTVHAGTASATLVIDADETAPMEAFNLSVRGVSGEFSDEAMLALTVDETAEPNGLPVIHAFEANPAGIAAGASSVLSWNVSDATNVTLNPGGIEVDGQGEHIVSPAATTVYTLTASNAVGQASAQATVTVASAEPGPFMVGYVGLVSHAIPDMGDVGTATGAFYSVTTLPPVPDEGLTLDTCLVFTEDELDDLPPPTVPGPELEPDPALLDAGDTLSVYANGSLYGTLERSAELDLGLITYLSAVLPPLPEAGLTIDIPGADDGFPAFSRVPFPDVPNLNMTAPADLGAITRHTTFTWTGSSDGVVFLFGVGENSAGEAVGFGCVVRDDGDFSFPAQTQAELAAAGFETGALMSSMRWGWTRHVDGNAVLVLTVLRMAPGLDPLVNLDED